MPMKGRFPIRRTLQYLTQGEIVFKGAVKVMTVNYNARGELSEGARKFVFYLDSGEQVLVDVEDKSNKEIVEHVKKILGKSEETLQKEEQEKKKLSHPATFGPKKYHLRECMCEIEGQIPCPGLIPLPKEMTGKYKAAMKEKAIS
ncbi:unnamed protein product [Lepidochelys kempii]